MRARAVAGVPKGKLFLLPQEIQEINVKDHPPLASLGGGRENKKRGIGVHPALSLGALRPELDREHLGRYIDEWIGTRPRLVPFY
jgi:hypothetical protein